LNAVIIIDQTVDGGRG